MGGDGEKDEGEGMGMGDVEEGIGDVEKKKEWYGNYDMEFREPCQWLTEFYWGQGLNPIKNLDWNQKKNTRTKTKTHYFFRDKKHI